VNPGNRSRHTCYKVLADEKYGHYWRSLKFLTLRSDGRFDLSMPQRFAREGILIKNMPSVCEPELLEGWVADAGEFRIVE
jgi:hypothetical protein